MEDGGDSDFMLSELAKAQKGENETDEAKEFDISDMEKMNERDFLHKLHEFLTNYINRPPRSDNAPNF